MMKEKFLIDQLSTTNANLVDQIGRMQTHIENLWEEVGFKNEKINDLNIQVIEVNEKLKIFIKNFMKWKLENLVLKNP